MQNKSLFAAAFAVAAIFAFNAQAAPQPADDEPQTGVIANFPALGAPQTDTGTPSGLYIPSTVVSFQVSGAPCFGGNTGCGAPAGTIAVPFPQSVIANGSSVAIVTLLQDTTYTGAPTIEVIAKQGTTKIFAGKTTFSSPLMPGYVAYGTFPFKLPTTKGAVTVTVELVSGTTVLAKGGTKFSID